MMALGLWMFTSKWIKLVGHYIRYPVDLLLLPISVVFGYFHGAIKMYAVMTLNVVSNVFFFPFLVSSFPHFPHFLISWLIAWGCVSGKTSGLPKRQPAPHPPANPRIGSAFSYDMPASQRFDHNSSLVQMPLSTIVPCASCLYVPFFSSFCFMFCVLCFVFSLPHPTHFCLIPLIRLMFYPSGPSST